MRFPRQVRTLIFLLLTACCAPILLAQPTSPHSVAISVVDETGAAVPDAQISIQEPGRSPIHIASNYAGHATYTLQANQPYDLRIDKAGFYQTATNSTDPALREIRVVMHHEQMLIQQVSVSASVPGIDKEQTSDARVMSVPEIINVPYPTSRDIRNLLPFYPGIIADQSGQVHVVGSDTYATLDTLDGFDIRSPVSGNLAMRVSSDAVRTIDERTTRYPVEYGRATGGVIAFTTGMGDNKFRFNATNFVPSFENVNGLRFDKLVPRFTFSGPLIKDHAWFFDGLELEFDNIYIRELPANADTNHLIRGSNLLRFQVNTTPSNIISAGLLYNLYHSPYDGLSSLVPQESTTRRNTIAWLPYFRNQFSFHNGALLDAGLGIQRIRDGYEPRGSTPFAVTPEQTQGSYFENATGRSQRVEANAALYLPPQHWFGIHNFKSGIDLDRIGFGETVFRAPVSYLREDRTLSRLSTFPVTPRYTNHNIELGAYLQDRWSPTASLIVEPGLRFDWDQIIRHPEFAPRLAVSWSPARLHGATKLSAGTGLYYEHTQLEYLERALAGIRYDTYYASDGVTPITPPLLTTFTFDQRSLHEARALNWSIGVEQKLPRATYLTANLIRKRISDAFAYGNEVAPAALAGTYALTNTREDHDTLEEVDLRHTFAHGYTLFGAYAHSSAHTNSAIDYVPTISMLGPQQGGPFPWDSPNRILSWGWLPFDVPWFRKNWDFVYTLDWRTGFPWTSVDVNDLVVGAAGSRRFPGNTDFSPGLEWRFHFRGSYFGLRGVIENVTDSGNYTVVNNNVGSPQYGTFTEPFGRSLNARLRLINSK
ncbi:MAG TPA: TonB-dependent receptor [Terracidiphilus sp.]|jgi:hypothetical protein